MMIKEDRFNINTCLTISSEKQCSKESTFLRKGRLGKTMKCLYISFCNNKDYHDYQRPPIQLADLT